MVVIDLCDSPAFRFLRSCKPSSPCDKCLSYLAEQTWTGIVDVTLGNAVELIISLIALIKYKQTKIVQYDILGCILVKALLVPSLDSPLTVDPRDMFHRRNLDRKQSYFRYFFHSDYNSQSCPGSRLTPSSRHSPIRLRDR